MKLRTNNYAKAICFGCVVWRTLIEMSGHCGVMIMMDVTKVTVESGE